jgi:hypothetical protein
MRIIMIIKMIFSAVIAAYLKLGLRDDFAVAKIMVAPVS